MKDLYVVLGVKPTATDEEIQQAFIKKKKNAQKMLELAQEGEDEEMEEEAAQKLQLIFQAKKTLSDPDKRAAYDENNGFAAADEEEEEPVKPARKAARRFVEEAEEEEEPVKPARKAARKVVEEAEEEEEEAEPTLGQSAFKPKRRPSRDIEPLWIAVNKEGPIYLEPKMANRHGLIAGATGTGKTVTLKVLAEHFSNIGVPVFLADIKGDVWTMCQPGEDSAGLQKRLHTKLGLPADYKVNFQGYPLRFWDVFGEKGLPVRTTISEMGPELLSRLLELNETQAGVLNIVFRYADDNNLLILDMKDLRAMVTYCADHAAELKTLYGNITSASIGAIQRALLRLQDAGGEIFFGEPALDLNDWFEYDEEGRGVINLLHCTELFQQPILYSTFLLWMLSGLYELLPEKGDAEKPEMVFFFDEAHLIFKDAPKSLLSKIEQVIRLIRSKGVGVYFISQVPADIPDTVLSQLGNKIQHALRAYTPKDQVALKSAAASFRANPKINCERALAELGTGEALISLMDIDGKPSMVQRAYVMPPESYLGTLDEEIRQDMIHADTKYYKKYQKTFDRVSAYEVLSGKVDQAESKAKIAAAVKQQSKEQERLDREATRRQEKLDDREYKRQQLEEDREYKRQQREEELARKAEEREEARRLKQEEADRRAAEREEARRLKQEEADRRAAEREAAREEKKKMDNIKLGLSVVKSSLGTSVIRGLFGMLKK